MTADPQAQRNAPPAPVAMLARWCELVSFALDADERERVDALLELAAELEDALDATRGEVAA